MTGLPPIKVGDQIAIHILKLVHGGSGLAKYDDFVIFCDYVTPGEEVFVEITKLKKSHAFAKKIKTLTAGPEQRNAPCRVFSECGACNWQNINYQEQIKQKRNIIHEQLSDFVDPDFSFITSPEWYYRNRIQVRSSKNQIGFFKKGSHEIIDMSDCRIIEEDIKKYALNLPRESSNKIVKYEVYKDRNGEINASQNKKHAEISGFSQVNTHINQALVNHVSHWIQEAKTKKLLDLYCGQGNFSLALHKKQPELEITAIDNSISNIKRAQQKPSEVRFILSDASEWLSKQQVTGDASIIMDPPRTGASRSFIDILSRQKFHSLLYISCDISSFRRDLGYLFQKRSDLKVVDFAAFDMFPQTHHFETLALIQAAY